MSSYPQTRHAEQHQAEVDGFRPQILLPEKNRRDLEELPASVRDKLHFVYVKNVDDVLNHALVK